LRGQCFDGSSNMSRHLKRTQAWIAKDHPTSLYVHCAAHNLNLSISFVSEIPPIRSCMGLLRKCNLSLIPLKENKCYNIKCIRYLQNLAETD
ncbi:Zinc finger MYM-type protein 1, partial [Gonioctena quinquepunctata]